MANPRLASKPPRACAACNGQYIDRLHVDYMAGYEGGLIDPNRPRAGHVDWLVICENCIRRGAELLPEYRSQLTAALQRVTDLEAQLTAAQDYADRIEDAFQRRPAERAERAPKAAPAKAARKPRYEAKASA
jgi:hypothetical protein